MAATGADSPAGLVESNSSNSESKNRKKKKCSPYFYLLVLFISADRMQTLPSRVQRETRADNYSSGPDGGYATAAAGQSHR